MTDITEKNAAGLPTNFDPEKSSLRQDVLKEAARLAAKHGEWDECKRALDVKTQEVVALVAWWEVHVKDGRPEKSNARLELLSRKEAEDRCGFKQPQISRLRKVRDNPEKFTRDELEKLKRRYSGEANEGRHGGLVGAYEWYTPQTILDAVHATMGGIDLDPASNPLANEKVGAKTIFTEKDNGLEQDWHGRVFINPPFAHPTVLYFATKLLEEMGAGRVTESIWLSNATVDVDWWQSLASVGVTCFHRGRIKFYGPDGKLQAPTMGQAIIYLGENRDVFRANFSPLGVVME